MLIPDAMAAPEAAPMNTPGGLLPTVHRAIEDVVILESREWPSGHTFLAGPAEAMVERSDIPERSFTRRFARPTGLSPIGYV